jgi:hypothetical protein
MLILLTRARRAAQRSAATASRSFAPRNARALQWVVTKFPRAPKRLDIVFPHNPLYFVTCCTYRRRPHLANDHVHASFIKFSQRARVDFGIAVGRYVLLPDHLHLFVALPGDVKLGDWIGTVKRVLARAVNVVVLAIPSGSVDSSITS